MAEECTHNYDDIAEDIIYQIQSDYGHDFKNYHLTFHLFDIPNKMSVTNKTAEEYINSEYNSRNINNIYIFVMNYDVCKKLCSRRMDKNYINFISIGYNKYYVFVPSKKQCDDSIIIYMSLYLKELYNYNKHRINVYTDDNYDKNVRGVNNFLRVKRYFLEKYYWISSSYDYWNSYVTLIEERGNIISNAIRPTEEQIETRKLKDINARQRDANIQAAKQAEQAAKQAERVERVERAEREEPSKKSRTDNNDSMRLKYLKYKQKYLELKKLIEKKN